MGKGDKKTKRGKLFQGSYGIKRPKNTSKKDVINPLPPNKTSAVKEAIKEVKDIREVKDTHEVKDVKEVKTPRTTTKNVADSVVKSPKPAAVKKEVKQKKADTE